MINPINVQIKMLDPELPAPAYTKPGDAGADLRSRVDFTLDPGERALVPTGLALALPEGYVGLVHPRSGLAVKHGIHCERPRYGGFRVPRRDYGAPAQYRPH